MVTRAALALARPWKPTSWDILNAVESWAQGMVMVRESGALMNGRMDALLIPTAGNAPMMKSGTNGSGDYKPWWTRPRIVGVEVKVSRSDFQRGLNEGQFDRYADTVHGLYLAVPHGLVKRSEVPERVGLLVARDRDNCACVRHPQWGDGGLTQESMWAVIFQLAHIQRDRERELARREHKLREATAYHFTKRMHAVLSKIEGTFA